MLSKRIMRRHAGAKERTGCVEMMASSSFEFFFGVACLAMGLLCRLGCWYLETQHAEALKQADDWLEEDGLRGVTVLGTFQFGAALLLFIGAAMVAGSWVAYGRL